MIISLTIVFDGRSAVEARDYLLDGPFRQRGTDFVAIVVLVAEDFGLVHVVELYERVDPLRFVAFGVCVEVNFARATAAQAPERLPLSITLLRFPPDAS
jgi:hypothetical protein